MKNKRDCKIYHFGWNCGRK